MAAFSHIHVLIIVITVLCLVSTTQCGLQYYVLPSNGNDQDCPIGKVCHTLSHCINDLMECGSQPISANVTFIFLTGEHSLNETIVLSRFYNLSFIGQGQWVHGPHEFINQSTVIIRCVSNEIEAFVVHHIAWVFFYTLTITDCQRGLVMYNIELGFNVMHVSVQNNSYVGLVYYGGLNHSATIGTPLTGIIANSNFYQNCLLQVHYTHSYNCYQSVMSVNDRHVYLNISDSTFSSGSFLEAALGLLLFDVLSTKCVIVNCLFFNNTAAHSGGLHISCVSKISQGLFYINGTKFIDNSSKYVGGMNTVTDNSGVYVTDCYFQNNYGVVVGGVLIQYKYYTNLSQIIENTVFHGTVGCSLSIVARLNFVIKNVSVTFSTIPTSTLYQTDHFSAISLSCSFDVFRNYVYLSNISILNNAMNGLSVSGCYAQFYGHPSTLMNNSSPSNGGGIWLDKFANIFSDNKMGSVSFINNTAVQKGGAIYSEVSTLPSIFGPLSNRYPIHCTMTGIISTFENNRANYGYDIYGGLFFGCIGHIREGTFLDNFSKVLNCQQKIQLFNFTEKPLVRHVSSDAIAVCLCTDYGIVDCYNRSIYRELYPGQSIALSLVTVGMCGGVSPGAIVTEADGINITLGNSNQQTGKLCKQFHYQLKQLHLTNGHVSLLTFTEYRLTGSSINLNISFLPCPFGLNLTNGVCSCSHIITEILGDNHVHCNISLALPITRSGNNWLSYNDQYNCTVAHRNCPFDYCNNSAVSLSLNEPDLQCTLNRSGTLCGRCQSGLSLMLSSNQCGSCDNKYLSLVAVFILAGIALVVFLLVCNLTVSVGSISGLLFYANIVKLNEIVFFNGATVPVLSQFISWLNLDLGIQTCFFDGLDGYWKTWLQFVFPIYIWLLIGSIIIGSHYFGKMSRLFGNNTVPVLATLILMSYSKLLRTITNVLMFATIQCDNEQWNVWSVDGNIPYLSAKHAPLFVVSGLFLLTGLLYAGLVFSSQWVQKCSGKFCKSSRDPAFQLKPLIDAYSGPYKDKYRYWTGLLLIVRVVLTPVFSYTSGFVPQLTNYITVVVSLLLVRMASIGVYKSQLLSNLELFYYMNLAIVSLASALSDHLMWNAQLYIISVSSTLTLAVFTGTVIVHVYLKIGNKCCTGKAPSWLTNREEQVNLLHDNALDSSSDDEQGSPARIVQCRESLIFDFSLAPFSN